MFYNSWEIYEVIVLFITRENGEVTVLVFIK